MPINSQGSNLDLPNNALSNERLKYNYPELPQKIVTAREKSKLNGVQCNLHMFTYDNHPLF